MHFIGFRNRDLRKAKLQAMNPVEKKQIKHLVHLHLYTGKLIMED